MSAAVSCFQMFMSVFVLCMFMLQCDFISVQPRKFHFIESYRNLHCVASAHLLHFHFRMH